MSWKRWQDVATAVDDAVELLEPAGPIEVLTDATRFGATPPHHMSIPTPGGEAVPILLGRGVRLWEGLEGPTLEHDACDVIRSVLLDGGSAVHAGEHQPWSWQPSPRTRLRGSGARALILNHMVQCETADLDASFAALADGTRRGVLEQLGRVDSSITDLAEKFHMTLTGMRKHVGVLEEAGLVITEKVGRVRRCRIGARRLDEVAAWIDTYHQLWDVRFCELDKVVEELKRKENMDGRERDE